MPLFLYVQWSPQSSEWLASSARGLRLDSIRRYFILSAEIIISQTLILEGLAFVLFNTVEPRLRGSISLSLDLFLWTLELDVFRALVSTFLH